MLVVRELVLGPKPFTQLHRGLPRIPTNVMPARLKEMEAAWIVRREVRPRPASGVTDELTEYGHELEDLVLRLGRWGARSLGEPGPEDSRLTGLDHARPAHTLVAEASRAL